MFNLVRCNNTLVPRRDDLFYPFENFFNKAFDDILSDFSGLKSASKVAFPRMDVVTDKDKWIVELGVSGMEKDDINIEILDESARKMLVISGRMSESGYSDKASWSVKELRRSAWERRIYLPDSIVGEPEATLKNGVLKLTWKIPEVKLPEKKSIPIKSLD